MCRERERVYSSAREKRDSAREASARVEFHSGARSRRVLILRSTVGHYVYARVGVLLSGIGGDLWGCWSSLYIENIFLVYVYMAVNDNLVKQ